MRPAVLILALMIGACGGGWRESGMRTAELVGGRAVTRVWRPDCTVAQVGPMELAWMTPPVDYIVRSGEVPVMDADRTRMELTGALRGTGSMGVRELLGLAGVTLPAALRCSAEPGGSPPLR